jgi:hypothetical protein
VCLPPVEQEVAVQIPVRAEGSPPPRERSTTPLPPYVVVFLH